MTLELPAPQTFLTALVGVTPSRARHISPELVLQRLHYVTGRTLTETAIETEQAWVEARLGVAGRRLSAGIVKGLGIGVADQSASAGAFRLSAGRGISPGGQDISVLKPAQFRLDDLPELGTAGDVDGNPRGLIALVLEPIVVEIERLPQDATRTFAFEDPCPPDATTAPYLDFVLQDAARMGWVALDDMLAGADAARAPNVAAEALRRLEEVDAGSVPWADLGVPLSIMFVAGDGTISWHHRAAVVRRGGMLPLGGKAEGDRIRQARLEGLIEETEMATRRSGWGGSNGAGFIRHMPPAGVLSRKCWDRHDFFPGGWAVAQAPIPLSQLDAALEAAGRLAPFDLDRTRDRVKFLVPVPDEHYAADLLEPVTPPDFNAVRTPLRARVGDTLALRNAYREQAREVQGVIDFSAVSDFSEAEEDPIAGEEGFPATQPEPVLYDVEAVAALTAVFDGLNPVLFTGAQMEIVDPERLAGALDPEAGVFGVTPFVTTMRGLIDGANDTIDVAFTRVQAEIYRLRQIMLNNDEATKLATFPALAGLAKGSNSFAMSEGLKAHFLARKEDAGGTTPGGGPGGLVRHNMVLPLAVETGGSAFTGIGRLGGGLVLGTEPIDTGPEPLVGLRGSTILSGFGTDSAALSFGAFFSDVSMVSGAGTNVVKDLVDNTRASLVDDAILAGSQAKRTGILRAAPLPGDIRDVRTATIADRLKASSSVNAKASAVRIKADVLRQVQGMGLSLEGLKAPLTSSRDRVLLPKADIDRVIEDTLTPAEQTEFAAVITERRATVANTGSENWEVMGIVEAQATTTGGSVDVTPMTRLGTALLRETGPITLNLLPALTLSKQLDPDPGKGTTSDDTLDDESAYLSSAVTTLESAIAIIRTVEARVLAIADAVEHVAARLPGLNKVQGRWETALTLADQDIDEARHDLRVAISLIDEETARLAELAAHRQRVLGEEVKFVAYTRPRALTAHSAGDTLGLLLPGRFEDPLPASLKRDMDLPDDLEAMIEALREMPLGWFSANPELAAKFTRPKYLTHLFKGVKYRALAAKARQSAAAPKSTRGSSMAIRKIDMISTAYQSLTLQLFDARATLDLKAVEKESWSERKRRALALLSLNDLIESGKQPAVAKLAATEIEHMERVIHALWQLARQVQAPIRLLWAQTLSEYDTVTRLDSLARLPGWDLIAFGLRKKMERLNGWLFSRMESGVREPQGLMTDLVRVALLLSAHAPVADIVAARIEENQTAKKGGAVDISIRRGTPKIGMQVSFLDANLVQARGVLRDVYGTKARVEILHTIQPLVTLSSSQQVTLFAPASLTKTGT